MQPRFKVTDESGPGNFIDHPQRIQAVEAMTKTGQPKGALTMSTRYNLVFEGKIAAGKAIEGVKYSLRLLFKSAPERIDSLFTPDKRTIIKGDMDYEQAVKFKGAFEKTGALCALVEMNSTALPEDKPVQSVIETDKTSPVTFKEPREFYLKRIFKLIISTAPFTLVLSAMRVPFNMSQMPKEGATVLTVFFLLLFVLTIYLIRKFWQPALILSAQGVEYRLANLFKPQILLWRQIQGITIDEQTVFGKTQVKVRLILSPDSKGTTEMEIGLGAFERGDEALSLLKQMIPEKKSQDFSKSLQRFKPVSTKTMKYRDIEIVHEGLVTTAKGWKKNRIVVPWDNIVSVKTEGFVIAGYGPVVVGFLDNGVERKVLIRASTTEQYHDCIKLVIANAKNATLDPGVIAILEYPIHSAKADMIAVLLIFTGVVFGIAGSIILGSSTFQVG
ncbi:MAG: hypothetical protein M0023_16390 [Desulfobacteraceae bacterium]|nr:hypothetical protein [Desulfobacteraceae bacterium]